MTLSGLEIYVLPDRPVKRKIFRRKRYINLRSSPVAVFCSLIPVP